MANKNHSFSNKIMEIVKEDFKDNFQDVFDKSFILQKIRKK